MASSILLLLIVHNKKQHASLTFLAYVFLGGVTQFYSSSMKGSIQTKSGGLSRHKWRPKLRVPTDLAKL